MFKRDRWRCSFCRRPDSRVAKLVAGQRFFWLGPHVYICDLCAATANEIMTGEANA